MAEKNINDLDMLFYFFYIYIFTCVELNEIELATTMQLHTDRQNTTIFYLTLFTNFPINFRSLILKSPSQ